jgi:protein-L-isoaspartate O-methyltransferase
MPFDKLSGVMSKAQVDEARAAGRIYSENTRSFQLADRGHDETPKPDNVCPDGPACPDPECIEERKKIGIEPEPFEAMKKTLKAGVQVVSAPQLFPTPPELARQMVELAFKNGWGVVICAEMNDRCRILEPSAGTGNLIAAIRDAAKEERSTLYELVAVEINNALAESMKQRRNVEGGKDFSVLCDDFLTCNGVLGKFDRILMNPPFERGSDIKHIQHAMTFLNPGGRLVAICANGPKQQEELKPLCDQWIDLPAGSFESQGTGVNTAMLVITH